MLRMYGDTTRDWGREYDSVAVLLTILQLTEGYINGVAGILDNQAGDKFWFGSRRNRGGKNGIAAI
ncbi:MULTISPECIES: hypothetical protein [Nostoc]|uniref:Transposase n=1 Tax=Nostoc paludosum FACHB-159 TaxID=2692908 RepID=A0ABR8KH60_9NOSO|nr:MULTISPECIES: hypothetical protein [Nostoc]MBD2682557.1 hypothetical protein [Nostoc sp. FACHB-857]MBD2738889.1 hypothetical protein [Nostoc paludosum FACHB-159]